MAVWTLANMKGGVGKTTSALMLGRTAAEAGRRVLLVDLDLNGQLSRLLGHWPEGAGVLDAQTAPVEVNDNLFLLPAPGPDFPLDGLTTEEGALGARLAALADDFDLCVLDTPSGYVPFLRSVLHLTDVWITPTHLAPTVRQASAHYLLRMARLALAEGARMKVRLLPVQYNPHLGSHRIGLEALRKFVGSERVLPPVRQDGRFHHADRFEFSVVKRRPVARDYARVFTALGG